MSSLISKGSYQNKEERYAIFWRSNAIPEGFSCVGRPFTIIRYSPAKNGFLEVKAGEKGVVIGENFTNPVPIFFVAFQNPSFVGDVRKAGCVNPMVLAIGYRSYLGQFATMLSQSLSIAVPTAADLLQHGAPLDRITGVYQRYFHILGNQTRHERLLRPSFKDVYKLHGAMALADAVAGGLVGPVRKLFNRVGNIDLLEIIEAAAPVDRSWAGVGGVYMMLYVMPNKESLVYIGQTTDFVRRQVEHSRAWKKARSGDSTDHVWQYLQARHSETQQMYVLGRYNSQDIKNVAEQAHMAMFGSYVRSIMTFAESDSNVTITRQEVFSPDNIRLVDNGNFADVVDDTYEMEGRFEESTAVGDDNDDDKREFDDNQSASGYAHTVTTSGNVAAMPASEPYEAFTRREHRRNAFLLEGSIMLQAWSHTEKETGFTIVKSYTGLNVSSPLAEGDVKPLLAWTKTHDETFVYYKRKAVTATKSGGYARASVTVGVIRRGKLGSWNFSRASNSKTLFPKVGDAVYPVVEFTKDGSPHPKSFSNLPEIGCFKNWNQARSWALSLTWFDTDQNMWIKNYYYNQAGATIHKNEQRQNIPGAIGPYTHAIGIYRYLNQIEVTNPPEWAQYLGVAEVYNLQFNHLQQEIKYSKEPPAAPITLLEKDVVGKVTEDRYTVNQICQLIHAQGIPGSAINNPGGTEYLRTGTSTGRTTYPITRCNRCQLSQRSVERFGQPTITGRTRVDCGPFDETNPTCPQCVRVGLVCTNDCSTSNAEIKRIFLMQVTKEDGSVQALDYSLVI